MDNDRSIWNVTKFYIPLLLQAFSQSLTYPLVAAIVSHGPDGVIGLAAFAQGQAVMFMIAALGGGLITTGMLFSRDQEGFRQFKRLNLFLCLSLVSLQTIACLPPLDIIIFQKILGLEEPLASIARESTLYGAFMQIGFFLRNVPFVILYNAKRSAAANAATLARIVLTASFTPLFVTLRLVGPMWGLVAMTIPVALEMGLAYWLARPNIRALPASLGQESSFRTQFLFTMPLSFGGFLLATAGFMIAAFIAQAAEPNRMLAIHYVTIGIGNPVVFSALRMQTVALMFPPQSDHDHFITKYAFFSGLVLALVPLFFQLPPIASWYFGDLQNVPVSDIPLATNALWIFSAIVIVQSLRGHAEGIAAWIRRPNAIFAGQAANLAALVCCLFTTLQFGLPGYLMGVTALFVAALATLITVRLGILWAKMENTFGKPIHPIGEP